MLLRSLPAPQGIRPRSYGVADACRGGAIAGGSAACLAPVDALTALDFLRTLPTELAITVANPDTWRALGLALLLGAGCWVFGVWIARTVGLLRRDAPAGEVLAIGLASGLMVLAAWWAALWSGGRSSFTPAAIGFAIAIGLSLARRGSRVTDPVLGGPGHADTERGRTTRDRAHRRSLLVTAVGGGSFVVAIALLYGSTLTLSPRDGAQPIERVDIAFYSVLGRDLAETGTESITGPSGFTDLPGDTAQAWYHWGELWLASAVIAIFDVAPVAARHLIVLPALVLAAAALTGTLVRRLSGRSSRLPFLFGFLACLILAPAPVIPSTFFGQWGVGMVVAIAVFGLVAVVALFVLYALAILDTSPPTWPLAGFVGTAIALLLPAHLVIAVLGLVGVLSGWGVRATRSLWVTRRLPLVPAIWQRVFVVAAIAVVSTVAWGAVTGHGFGLIGGAPTSVDSFNDSWRNSVTVFAIQGGLLLTPLVAWPLFWRRSPRLADLCLGTTAIVVAGAIAWGWRLSTFNAFYFFFGGIAVIATPVAASAVWLIVQDLRARHVRLMIAAITLCVVQVELDVVLALGRLQAGASDYPPIPISLLRAIRALPPDAKLAYACQPLEEVSFVNSKLLGLNAHTGRRVVPMCFQADAMGPLFGLDRSLQRPAIVFLSAPQYELFPDWTARPSSQVVASFLRANAIEYIYADAIHPNSLVDDAVPVALEDEFEVLRLP